MIQERIINYLKQISPKHSQLVATLSRLLNLSKRAIYSRLENKTTFTLEEVGLIIQQFDIKPNELFSAESNHSIASQPSPFISLEKFIDKILNNWANQVEQLLSKEQASIFMFTNKLPFSLAFHYPDLIKYRLYCMMRYLWKSPDCFHQTLDLSSEVFKSVPYYCNRINKTYQQLPLTEIWGSSTFHSCLKYVNYLYKIDQLSLEDSQLLLNRANKLLDLAEQFANNGGRQRAAILKLQTPTPNYQLIINDTLVVDEYTLMVWKDGGRSQLSIYHPIHGEIEDAHQKEHLEKYCLLLQETGTQISSVNSIARKTYFKKIKTAIQQEMEEV